ncbi:hypothetical protein BDFB_009616, partial [Asbolus verrucosus]
MSLNKWKRLLKKIHIRHYYCKKDPRILKSRLHMIPYKVSMVQQLLRRDHNSRIFFTDEAWFRLSGYANKQNYRTWSVVNTHNSIEVSLHPVK